MMRVLDVEAILTVAHTVDADHATLATPHPVGLALPAVKDRRKPSQTRCGLEVGPTWTDAARYEVPDCPECVPSSVAYEQATL